MIASDAAKRMRMQAVDTVLDVQASCLDHGVEDFALIMAEEYKSVTRECAAADACYCYV
jgi:hypothetical protein